MDFTRRQALITRPPPEVIASAIAAQDRTL